VTKRFLILALFVLATSWWAATMLRRLAVVRVERATAAAMPPRIGGNAAARVQDVARRRSLTLMRVAADGGGTTVVMQGPERAMRLALSDLEAGRPVVRFQRWQIRPEAGFADRLRFEGVAMVTPR
jgi:hypothetical protein